MTIPQDLADRLEKARRLADMLQEIAFDRRFSDEAVGLMCRNHIDELLAALRSSASARLADIPTDALDVALHLRNAPNDVPPAIAIAAASYLERLWHAVSASAREVETIDFRAHLQRQRDWSEKTLGPGPRTAGVIDHIRKELNEIEADPSDISEWIDVVILGLDGAWRAGHSPDQIIAALVAKQTKNESRKWPDWRTVPADKAIEHDRALDRALAPPASPTTLAEPEAGGA